MLQDALDAKPHQERRQNRGGNSRNVVAATMPMNTEFNEVYNAGMAAILGENPTYGGS